MTDTPDGALLDEESVANIVATLGCDASQIHDVFVLTQGLTNRSFHFTVDSGEYVYRQPGVGTEYLVNRESEAASERLAFELGLDRTFIHEDPGKGWKLSHFIVGARQLDPHDEAESQRAMDTIRALHAQDISVEGTFDFYDEAKGYEAKLLADGPIDIAGYAETAAKIDLLEKHIKADGAPVCLTHNDFFYLNLLIDQNDELSLIDWEYAGMADYANDYGTYTVCCELSFDEAERALTQYFERTPTLEERRHNFGHVILAGWCWYLWSLIKEAEGELVGEWLDIYLGYALDYIDKVLEWYGESPEPSDISAAESHEWAAKRATAAKE